MELINRICWAVATASIVLAGIYFSFRLSFLQFRFKDMFSNLFSKNKFKGLSPFKVLMMTLAGRIGVGSIAGVALGIAIGGVGSIFWLWIITIFSAVLAYGETVLGIVYRKKDSKNIYKGGPSYYLKFGLGKTKLGNLYAILILVSYIGGFLGIQTNTITKSLIEITSVSPYIIGILIVLFTSMIIFGGVSKIANVTSKLVPFMTILYLGISGYIILNNLSILPLILRDIVSDAFHIKPFFGGVLTTLIVGVQRGIFSSEAGLGTGSIAASTSSSNSPASQGYIQILGVYITSLCICTATAFIILTSNYNQILFTDINGIEITQYAFNYHLGNVGNIFIFMSIFLFSFSTILTGYYYGESSLKYFFNTIKSSYLFILKIVTLIVLFLGCIVSSSFLWQLVDILVAIMSVLNIYALFSLRKDIIQETESYYAKKKRI